MGGGREGGASSRAAIKQRDANLLRRRRGVALPPPRGERTRLREPLRAPPQGGAVRTPLERGAPPQVFGAQRLGRVLRAELVRLIGVLRVRPSDLVARRAAAPGLDERAEPGPGERPAGRGRQLQLQQPVPGPALGEERADLGVRALVRRDEIRFRRRRGVQHARVALRVPRFQAKEPVPHALPPLPGGARRQDEFRARVRVEEPFEQTPPRRRHAPGRVGKRAGAPGRVQRQRRVLARAEKRHGRGDRLPMAGLGADLQALQRGGQRRRARLLEADAKDFEREVVLGRLVRHDARVAAHRARRVLAAEDGGGDRRVAESVLDRPPERDHERGLVAPAARRLFEQEEGLEVRGEQGARPLRRRPQRDAAGRVLPLVVVSRGQRALSGVVVR